MIKKIFQNHVLVKKTNATGANTSKFPKKVDLTFLKSDVDKLDVGKLETTPAGLSQLSVAVIKKVIKKTIN